MKAYVLWPLCASVPGALVWLPLCAVVGCSPIAWATWITAIVALAATMLVFGIIFERARPQLPPSKD